MRKKTVIDAIKAQEKEARDREKHADSLVLDGCYVEAAGQISEAVGELCTLSELAGAVGLPELQDSLRRRGPSIGQILRDLMGAISRSDDVDDVVKALGPVRDLLGLQGLSTREELASELQGFVDHAYFWDKRKEARKWNVIYEPDPPPHRHPVDDMFGRAAAANHEYILRERLAAIEEGKKGRDPIEPERTSPTP